MAGFDSYFHVCSKELHDSHYDVMYLKFFGIRFNSKIILNKIEENIRDFFRSWHTLEFQNSLENMATQETKLNMPLAREIRENC